MVAEALVAMDLKDSSIKSESGTLMNMESGEAANVHLSDESNGLDKVEVDTVPNDNFPKDAVDEWPTPKKIHVYYFVKFRSYEDPQLKAKIDQADKDLQKKNQARSQLFDQIKLKKSERAAIIADFKPLTAEDKRYRAIVDEKRKDMEPLHAALGKMRSANNAVREKGVGICSSEEELNELIQSLQYRIQHESNTLSEEKQLLKDIKQLEGTREKVIANAAMKAKLQDTFGQREEIQDQLKLIGGDLDGVRKEQSTVKSKIKQLEEQLKVVDGEIAELQEKLTAETQKKEKALEVLHAYKKQREERNASYYENRSILNKAKDFAARKDIAAVGELSHLENEKCFTAFKSNKAWREDYGKRILQSLDIRQLSRDGRIRNPEEKPLVAVVANAAEPLAVPVNAEPPKAKEETVPPVKNRNIKKADNKKLNEVDTNGKADNVPEEVDYFVPEKILKEPSEPKAIDVAKMKELKREEEVAKAKSAMERKKKLADKAAAKAAARAQKEAEKKEKEREKKAKKKVEASAPTSDADSAEMVSEEVESETTQGAVEEAPITPDVKQKENARLRRRSKVQVPQHKAILRRKKAPAYWKWVIPVGIGVSILLLAVLAYYYLF